jgi:hypothetical protein
MEYVRQHKKRAISEAKLYLPNEKKNLRILFANPLGRRFHFRIQN